MKVVIKSGYVWNLWSSNCCNDVGPSAEDHSVGMILLLFSFFGGKDVQIVHHILGEEEGAFC